MITSQSQHFVLEILVYSIPSDNKYEETLAK